VIFLDEVDALAPARGGGAGGGGGAAARLVAALAGEMDALAAAGARVAVLAATNRVEALDAALRRPGRFDREVEVPAPSPAERAEILEVFLARLAHALPPAAAAHLAADAHGFVAADLEALCADAAMGALRRAVAGGAGGGAGAEEPSASPSPLLVLEADFAAARARARPSALREVGLEVPRVRWADIGGGAALKRQLREAVEWPFSRGAALAALGAAPPRGVLLFGPPGCSKTLLARAVAAEAGLSFLAVKGGELLSKYLGESERALAAVFRRARAAAPAVVFFDELDGLVGWRAAGGSSSGDGVSVGDRVLATLLQEMDGLTGPGGGAPVVVLGATNRPDRLDAALLRPGRFDRLLYVPPPDAAARREILELHARGTPLLADVDLNAVADGAEGRSGADLAALLRRAALLALEEDMGAPGVGARHLAAAAAEAPAPGVSAELHASYARFRRQVDCD
jgi:AAA family ATPase